ncbi:hypothetical protein D3C86_1512070 [compost metagenome]
MLTMLVTLAKATKPRAITPKARPPILVIHTVGSLSPSAAAASRPTTSPRAAAPKMPMTFGQNAVRWFFDSRARLPM